ncbi:MAG: Lrp/AsnC family transcriptional regulator [Phycicoccus sp.]
MASSLPLDAADRAILRELVRDGRARVQDIAARVHLSRPTASDRMRRLERRRVITGYRAEVDLAAVGLPVLAFVALRLDDRHTPDWLDAVTGTPEVLEAHHVTGQDCILAKIAARDVSHLEELVAGLARHGTTTTSIVFSTPVRPRLTVPES